MNRFTTLVTLSIAIACLTGCHAGSTHPQSYCHKLTTAINSYDHGGTNNRTNAAQRARWGQEYQDMDCGD